MSWGKAIEGKLVESIVASWRGTLPRDAAARVSEESSSSSSSPSSKPIEGETLRLSLHVHWAAGLLAAVAAAVFVYADSIDFSEWFYWKVDNKWS